MSLDGNLSFADKDLLDAITSFTLSLATEECLSFWQAESKDDE